MTATQGPIIENGGESNSTKNIKQKKVLIIKKLLTLKLVLFIYYGGLGCLFPFLAMHMLDVGLNRNESKIISIVAPIVSILGPLIVGPLADRLASRKGATGKHLRILGAILMILGAIMYAILLAVPNTERFEEKRPLVGFGCDASGAILFQERIEEQRTCYYWEEAKVGDFILTNCSYTCQKPTNFEKLYKPWESSPYPPTVASAEIDTEPDYDETAPYNELSIEKVASVGRKDKDKVVVPRVEPPHLCVDREAGEPQLCHAFTETKQHLKLTATLRGAINKENATHSAEWCRYPLDGFTCNIPEEQVEYMHKIRNSECEPMVECEIYNPYNSDGSVLGETLMIGDPDMTFWLYLIIRSLAAIFPVATITVLNAAIIIATREKSTGRGDVGHQLVWAALGWAIFAPIIGAVGPHTTSYLIPIIVFLVMSLVAAFILLLAKEMPLSPPEWWWYTKSGMVAIPLSAIRKYCPETVALFIITILLGICWSVIDTYQGWYLKDLIGDLYESNVLSTLTLTVGALAAVPFLWYAEKIVDYCGHANILISSFAFYAVRFTVMSQLDEAWFILLMEAIEPLTLGLTWITIILYTRHIMPRRLTATGQALPVIAHFCFGKAIGAIIGFNHDYHDVDSFQNTYITMGGVSLMIALLYFFFYHFICGPRCGAKPQPPPDALLNGTTNGNLTNNPNGNYTPLRVYHNSRAKKGHFRY